MRVICLAILVLSIQTIEFSTMIGPSRVYCFS